MTGRILRGFGYTAWLSLCALLGAKAAGGSGLCVRLPFFVAMAAIVGMIFSAVAADPAIQRRIRPVASPRWSLEETAALEHDLGIKHTDDTRAACSACVREAGFAALASGAPVRPCHACACATPGWEWVLFDAAALGSGYHRHLTAEELRRLGVHGYLEST